VAEGESKHSEKGKEAANSWTAATEVVGKVYDDLGSPAAKEFGILLETVSMLPNVFLGPLRRILSNARNFNREFEERLNDRLRDVPAEQLVDPPQRVLIDAVEAAAKCWDEEQLRDLFVNLVASAMHIGTSKQVDPTFSAIIESMSSEDAAVFRVIAMGDLWVLNGLDGQRIIRTRPELHSVMKPSEASVYKLEHRLNLIQQTLRGSLDLALERSQIPWEISNRLRPIFDALADRPHSFIYYQLTPWGGTFRDVCLQEARDESAVALIGLNLGSTL